MHLMDEFHVTEAGMRAVLETLTRQNALIAELTATVEAHEEALLIALDRIEALELVALSTGA